MKEKLRRFKVIILGTMVILILLFLLIGYLLFFNKHQIKEYTNDVYHISYDDTWRLIESKKDSVLLKHGKNSIEVSIKTLEEEVRYNAIDTFIEDIKQLIKKDNKNYKLISEKKDTVTKRDLDGYKLLYEDKDKESYVVISKYNDKLFTIVYEAKDKEFDILLDSASFIIDHFSIQDEKFDLNQKLEEVKTTGITYSKDKSNLSSKKTERQIANHGYVVKYKLSEDILKDEFDSHAYYNWYEDKDENRISLSLSISPLNIYEYLTNELINQKEKNYKKIDEYKDIKVETDKLTNKKYNEYIYKISYEYDSFGIKEDGSVGDKAIKEEEYYVLYEIDPITTLVYEIKAHEKNISQDFIENLEITNKQKYGAYITRNIEKNNVVNEMKIEKADTKYGEDKKYYQVTLYTPKKYYERYYDNNNIYESRYFGFDFDKENEEYKTKIHYQLNNSSVETDIKLVKENIGSKKNASFTYVKDITVNNNTFKYYQASYKVGNTKYSNAYLFLELLNNDTYSNSIYLEISTKDDIIKEDMIEGLLNMKIEIKDYKN